MTSDFHRGENEGGTEYLDFRTIFKNGEVVEGFIARAGGMPAATGLEDHPHADRIATLRTAAADAMKDGRTDEYNRINKQLTKLPKERADA